MHNKVDFLIPAHNEAATVAAVSAACLRVADELEDFCTVTVIADHCSDKTAEIAKATGAIVLERKGSDPSKAQAVQMGVESTSGDIVALFDADCIGLTTDHLMHIVGPVLSREVVLSVGVIDYGRVLTPLVQRFPWSSGQRVIRRESFDWQDTRLSGYMIEMVMNESVGLSGGLIYSSVLTGVRHNSKLRKMNTFDGIQADLLMLKTIAAGMGGIDKSGLTAYFEGIRLRGDTEAIRQPFVSKRVGRAALRVTSQIFTGSRTRK